MNVAVKTLFKSETFFLTATMDALQIIAESNGRQMSDAVTAFKLRVPAVVEQVEKLVRQAAEDMVSALDQPARNV
ncbi:hypothetical protein [Stutzerimonas nitrititolerans]|uniref:hypothetical protein n=1 Tax=Stutzerimonas nitrititolerans TaxID=2482751 RepID=UPI0028AB4743|nr:hypothetical protein [Stutzerimonas nitrititolerans]